MLTVTCFDSNDEMIVIVDSFVQLAAGTSTKTTEEEERYFGHRDIRSCCATVHPLVALQREEGSIEGTWSLRPWTRRIMCSLAKGEGGWIGQGERNMSI